MENLEIQNFRKTLLGRRHTLLQSLETLRNEALHDDTPDGLGEISSIRLHPADLASESADQERRLQMANIEESELMEVDAALLRIEGGGYGTCQSCEEPIPHARLNAVPQARYCLHCQKMADQRERKS